MKETNTILSACIDRQVYATVKKLTRSMGVSISEYVRQLVINDLDRRTVFTTVLKQEPEVPAA